MWLQPETPQILAYKLVAVALLPPAQRLPLMAAVLGRFFKGYEAEGKAMIKGNAFLLRELAKNLIDNAIRYTQPGGHVTCRIINASTSILLEVEDNGVGITEEQSELVFERFYRVDDGITEGSGLGLAIVQEIASQHDSRVLGVATAAFQWTVSPWLLHIKLAAADWLVEHDHFALLDNDVPWWLLTHYPEASDLFTWLDGALILAYLLGGGFVLGTLLLVGPAIASRLLKTTWLMSPHCGAGAIPPTPPSAMLPVYWWATFSIPALSR